MPLREQLQRLMAGESLTRAQSAAAMDSMLDGAAPISQMAGLLVALRMKGETPDEIAGAAQAMRARAARVEVSQHRLIDTCGTGGDGSHTFNISTTAAFVAAAGGARVAKHGNRAVSSKCGSADVLAALGAQVELSPEAVAACIDECGIGFLFAPRHHAAMKHVAPVRKDLGMRTLFNLLGPPPIRRERGGSCSACIRRSSFRCWREPWRSLAATGLSWSTARAGWTRSPPAGLP